MKSVKEVPRVQIILNGAVMNLPTDAINKIPGLILEMLSRRFQYMSDDTMLEYLKTIQDLMLEAKLTFRITRHLAVMKSIDNFLSKPRKREDILDFLYELVFRANDEGRLPGFGFVTFESSDGSKKVTSTAYINPEKTPTYNL